MQTPPPVAFPAVPTTNDPMPSRRAADVTYQVVTVAAILLILVSVWIF